MTSTASSPRTRLSAKAFGVLAVVGLVVAFSLSSTLVKRAESPGVLVAFWRMVTVSVVWNLLLLSTGRRITMENVRQVFVPGVSFGLNLALFFAGATHNSVANAALIGSCAPFLTGFRKSTSKEAHPQSPTPRPRPHCPKALPPRPTRPCTVRSVSYPKEKGRHDRDLLHQLPPRTGEPTPPLGMAARRPARLSARRPDREPDRGCGRLPRRRARGRTDRRGRGRHRPVACAEAGRAMA